MTRDDFLHASFHGPFLWAGDRLGIVTVFGCWTIPRLTRVVTQESPRARPVTTHLVDGVGCSLVDAFDRLQTPPWLTDDEADCYGEITTHYVMVAEFKITMAKVLDRAPLDPYLDMILLMLRAKGAIEVREEPPGLRLRRHANRHPSLT
jgi:hypothetical protein